MSSILVAARGHLADGDADFLSVLAGVGLRGAGLLADDARELTYDLQRGRYRSCEYTGTAGLNRMPKEA